MRSPEGHEKADIDKFLTEIGAYVVKPATFGYGVSGHSDRVCCIDGWFVTIEVKREGAEPTARQILRMNEVREAGGWPFWGTAAKVIPELKTWITRMKSHAPVSR